MLACLPQGICSWDYLITDNDAPFAELTLSTFGEQAKIRYQGDVYEIVKEGMLSGQWTLEKAGFMVAKAEKIGAFSRTFELKADGSTWALRAVGFFSADFEILSNTGTIGAVSRVHYFTRRSFIDCDPSMPFPIQLFAFCLAVFMWWRAANDSAAATASS